MTLDIFFQMVVSAIWLSRSFAGVANLAGLCTWSSGSCPHDPGPDRSQPGHVRLFGTNITAIVSSTPLRTGENVHEGGLCPCRRQQGAHTLAPMICLFIPSWSSACCLLWAPSHSVERYPRGQHLADRVPCFRAMPSLSDYTLYFMVATWNGHALCLRIASLGVTGPSSQATLEQQVQLPGSPPPPTR